MRGSPLVDAGGQRPDAGDFELRQENGERHSGEDGEVKGRAGGGAQRLRRIGTGGAADARGGSSGASCAKSGSRSQNRSHVAGILHASENHEQGSARGAGAVHQIVERSFARFYQSSDALRMLGVGKALEETVSGAQSGKGYLGAVDKRREALVMTLAGFAEKHGLDGAAGTQSFFDKANAFDSHKTALRG